MNGERAFWDAHADDPPELMVRHGDWSESIEADLAELPPANEGDRMLDLGCGLGRLAVAYARKYEAVVFGVDVSPAMLERAEPHPLVSYWPCDGRVIPAEPPIAFAGAWSILMFQHIPRGAQASYIAQVARLLVPGGWFRFQTVLGDENTFLSHQVALDDPLRWCDYAGLEVESVGAGAVPEWLWVTARRPQVIDKRAGVR